MKNEKSNEGIFNIPKELQALTVMEVANALRIRRSLAYRLCRSGELPAIRLGNKRLVVPRTALAEFLRTPQPRPAKNRGDNDDNEQ